jgi:hypothetical protein
MPTNISNDGAEAARRGCQVIGFTNDLSGIGANTIITNANVVYNLRVGERVMVASMAYGLTTVSDSIAVELGFTDAANGAGSFTPITGHREVVSGAAIAGFVSQRECFHMPRAVSYSEGARSITFRITANDAQAQVSIEWAGWIEKE